MEKIDDQTLYRIFKVIFNSTRHRIIFNDYNIPCIREQNIKYIYIFPKDNDKNTSGYNISTKSLYNYFLKKDYPFTVCNFNGSIDENYSWNTTSVVLALPEYIDFASQNIKTKLKLSNDITYLDVLYCDEIKSTAHSCFNFLEKHEQNTLNKSILVKALLNEFED